MGNIVFVSFPSEYLVLFANIFLDIETRFFLFFFIYYNVGLHNTYIIKLGYITLIHFPVYLSRREENRKCS